MTELRGLLDKFNRKERYWLLRDAIGDPFFLSDSFRSKLKEQIGLEIPTDAWWAMDYHIDWLVAVLQTYPKDIQFTDSNDNSSKEIRGNQEDFDLVIAYEKQLILIEAKTGTFIDSQLESKLSRLGNLKWKNDDNLIDEHGYTKNDLHISFVLCSPKTKLQDLKVYTNKSARWAFGAKELPKSYHITLPFPKETAMISRCEQTRKKSSTGKHWGSTKLRRILLHKRVRSVIWGQPSDNLIICDAHTSAPACPCHNR